MVFALTKTHGHYISCFLHSIHTCKTLHLSSTHASSTQGWYIPRVIQFNNITMIDTLSNHGFVISTKHQFLGLVSCVKYFKTTSGNPGYFRFASSDDVEDDESLSEELHPLHVDLLIDSMGLHFDFNILPFGTISKTFLNVFDYNWIHLFQENISNGTTWMESTEHFYKSIFSWYFTLYIFKRPYFSKKNFGVSKQWDFLMFFIQWNAKYWRYTVFIKLSTYFIFQNLLFTECGCVRILFTFRNNTTSLLSVNVLCNGANKWCCLFKKSI